MVKKIILFVFSFLSLFSSFSQVEPPAILGTNQNIILWLSPDSSVYRKNGIETGIGEVVVTWKDISGNAFDFTSIRTKRPRLQLVNNKKFLSFRDGNFLSNSQIATVLNGLDAFSIFIEVKSNVTNTDNGIMYSNNSPDGDDEGLCIRYDANGANTGRSNLIKAGFQGNTWNNQIETTSNTQTTNTQVLTLTWTKGGKVYSYLDGILNDSSVNTLNTSLSGIESILLGKGAKDAGVTQGWDGYIGTVIFYNEQFDDDVVQEVAVDITKVTSINSGLWSDSTTWSCACVPNDTRTVFIENGHNVEMDTSYSIGGLEVGIGGVIDLRNHTLSLNTGDLKVLGLISSANASLEFNSSKKRQVINVPNASFKNITLNNDFGLDIVQGAVSINHLLTLNSGVLRTNDKLIFASTPTTSGHLAAVGIASDVVGKVTYQFYKDNMVRGWRYWSIPLSGATVLDMQGEISVTGSFDNPSEGEGIKSSSNSMYEFDAANQSYENYPKTGNSSSAFFTLGKGYAIYVRDEPGLSSICEISGTAHIGDFTQLLTYTNSADFEYNGWNLVGNPYLSPISWSDISESRKVNISNAIYLNDNTSGDQLKRSYVNGIGVPIGTNHIIAPSQAFWVQATAPGAYLKFKEEDKVKEDFKLYRIKELDGLVRFIVKSNKGEEDEFVVRYNENSSEKFDLSYDALQRNQNSLKAFSVSSDSIPMDVNNLPPSEKDSVRIVLENLVEGGYSIGVSEYVINDESYEYLMVDLINDVEIPLNELSNYSFQVTTETEFTNRFFLVTKKNQEEEVVTSLDKLQLNQRVDVYPNPTINKIMNIEYHNMSSDQFIVQLIDVFLSEFSHVAVSGNIELNLAGFPGGLYHLVLTEKNGNQTVNKIFVQ